MTGKEALERLRDSFTPYDEGYIPDEDDEALKVIEKELDQLDYIRKYKNVVGDFVKGTTKLCWENILIIVDDKTKKIWPLEDETITLNDCLKIAKKELGYKTGVILIICESYLKGIIYRYGNYTNCEDFEIAGRMHGFA